MTDLQTLILGLREKAIALYEQEVGPVEDLAPGEFSDDDPRLALEYSLETRTWQASVLYTDLALAAGDPCDTPEEACDALDEELTEETE